MGLPDYQSVTLPLLKLAASTPVLKLSDALVVLSDQFQLSQVEREEQVSFGSDEDE